MRTVRLAGELVAVALLALAVAPGGVLADEPATSGIVIRGNEMGGVWYEDPEDELVLLTGGTAQEGCTGNFSGDPLTEQFVVTPTGAIVLLVQSREADAWLYRAATVGQLCDAVLAGEEPALLAHGTVQFRITDNDLFASQTRTNSYGDRAWGTLSGLDGSALHVTAQFRAVVLPSDDGTCHCVHVNSDITVAGPG